MMPSPSSLMKNRAYSGESYENEVSQRMAMYDTKRTHTGFWLKRHIRCVSLNEMGSIFHLCLNETEADYSLY